MKKDISHFITILWILLFAVTLPVFSQVTFPDWHQANVNWAEAGYDSSYYKAYDSATLAWGETYNLQTFNLMYQTDQDTIWLHKLAKHGYGIMNSAKDSPPDTVVYDPRYDDGYLGWGTWRYSDEYEEYLVHDGHFCTELAKFVRTVYKDEVLYAQFGQRADSILHFIERNVAGKWYAIWDSCFVENPSGTLHGSYHKWVGAQNLHIVPINQYIAFGHFLLELIQISNTAHYSPVNNDYLDWYSFVVTDMIEEFRLMLNYNPLIDGYLWKYARNSGDNDISHSAIETAFAFDCYHYGVEFQFHDMQRFAHTLTRHLWKNPGNIWKAELWDSFSQSEWDSDLDYASRKWGLLGSIDPLVCGIQSGVYCSFAETGNYQSGVIASGIAALAWVNEFYSPVVAAAGIMVSEISGDGDNLADPGEELNLTVLIANWGNKATDSLTVFIDSNDPRIEITKNTTEYSYIGSLDTISNQSDPFIFNVNNDVTQGGKVRIYLTIGEGEIIKYDSLDITINPQPVLLVDDDGGAGYENYYTSGVLDNIDPYQVWDINTAGSPASYLNKYERVIWLTGDAQDSVLTIEDRNGIQSYLDNGGKFILFSSMAETDLLDNSPADTAFFINYLHALPNDTAQTKEFFTLQKADPRISPYYYMAISSNENQTFRAVGQAPNTGVLLEYFFGIAAIYMTFPHTMAYVTFGLENMQQGYTEEEKIEKRRYFLSGLIDILDNPSQIKYDVNNVPEEFRIRAYPNPFNNHITIDISNPGRDPSELLVFDLYGRLVKTIQIEDTNRVQWDGRNENGDLTGSGVYFIRIQNGKTINIHKIVQIK